MSSKYNRLKKSDFLKMDPLDLLDIVSDKMKVKIPNELTLNNQAQATIELSKAVQYETFCSELSDRANLVKKKLRLEGKKEEAELMQLRENVLKGHSRRMKRSYDALSRLFSIKNQEVQELRLLGITS